ncbi:MAG: c-type cytochrome domain-containing protein [Anaerolineae bacterium]
MPKPKNISPQRRSLKSGLVIVLGTVLLLVIVGGMGVIALNLVGYWGNNGTVELPPPLNLKISAEEVAVRRAQEEAQLESYGWVDKNASLVRIPISQAMALVADNRLPAGTPTTTPTPTVTPTPTIPPTPTPVPITPGVPAATPSSTPTPGPTSTPVPTVDLANVSFKNNVLPLFEQHCTKCHGGKEPEQGLVLESYEGVMSGSVNGPVIEPGSIENSYLIELVTNGKMPKKGPRLTPEEVQIITEWVKQGAPDN